MLSFRPGRAKSCPKGHPDRVAFLWPVCSLQIKDRVSRTARWRVVGARTGQGWDRIMRPLGLAQPEFIDEPISMKRRIFESYRQELAGVDALAPNEEPAPMNNASVAPSEIISQTNGSSRNLAPAEPKQATILTNHSMALAVACPLCSKETSESIFELRNSPPLQNKLLRTSEEALSAVRIGATYFYCAACHFAFNPAFDPTLVDYAKYYNGQLKSASYRRYVDKIAVDLTAACALGPESRILEIGCGSGYFLACLQKATGSGTVIGYDPTYRGEYGMQDNVRRRLLDANEVEGTFDLIVLRHSLEGLLHDASLLELIGRATSPSSRLYLEVTDLDHLLAERNPSLLFYEYYRYFSARAADIFLRKLGFRLRQLWSLFGGAYLGITATRAPA